MRVDAAKAPRCREERAGNAPLGTHTSWRENHTMHKIRVVNPHYDQSRPYSGKVGEVIGHWGSESNRDGREG